MHTGYQYCFRISIIKVAEHHDIRVEVRVFFFHKFLEVVLLVIHFKS